VSSTVSVSVSVSLSLSVCDCLSLVDERELDAEFAGELDCLSVCVCLFVCLSVCLSLSVSACLSLVDERELDAEFAGELDCLDSVYRCSSLLYMNHSPVSTDCFVV